MTNITILYQKILQYTITLVAEFISPRKSILSVVWWVILSPKSVSASTQLLRYILSYGSFRKLGVPYFGILIIRILLFRVPQYNVPYFRKLPNP